MAETRKLAAIRGRCSRIRQACQLRRRADACSAARAKKRSDRSDHRSTPRSRREATGDGVIIEFRSVVDAVRCAIELQNGMVERNAGLPPDRRIELRVGIHLGDVVEESDGDLMGDGVNIAARLEGIAKPGTICLSEDAYRQVKSRLDLAVHDLGATRLKNIAEPVRAYALEVGRKGKPTNRPSPLRTRSVRWAGAVFVVLVAIAIVAWQIVEWRSNPRSPGGIFRW